MGNKLQVGERFGKLEVTRVWVEPKGKRQQSASKCECRCECGGSLETWGDYLRQGKRKSCGCADTRFLVGSKHRRWKGYGEIGAAIWCRIKFNAAYRNIPFDITIQEGWELFTKQERKCALTGVELCFYSKSPQSGGEKGTASLDRIDSNKGYSVENCQWVHKTINLMKLDSTKPEFLEWCRKVVVHNSEEVIHTR